MLIASRILTILLLAGKASLTVAVPFQPWEISRLVVSALPDRGTGSRDEPLNTLAVEIRDVNDYANSTDPTQCITRFSYYSPPYGELFDCTEVPYGKWAFAFFPPEGDRDPSYWSPGQNFTLWFRLMLTTGDVSFDGQADFSVGGNMRGLCSAGGICSFAIKEEMTPFYVNQTESM